MSNIWDWMNSMFPLLEQGGPVMWPILFCSLLSLAIILERTWFLLIRSSRIISRPFLREVEANLDNDDIESAVIVCRKSDTMMARILLAGLGNFGAPRDVIREYMVDAGRRESHDLDRYLGILAAIAGVGPLLGLLGTILGMIDIFQEIASQHIGQYEALAGGIYVALYSTAAGLIVAIPSYLAYRSFAGIADSKVREMEDWAVDILNKLDFSVKKSGEEGDEK